jgi:hypothetical protein
MPLGFAACMFSKLLILVFSRATRQIILLGHFGVFKVFIGNNNSIVLCNDYLVSQQSRGPHGSDEF